jgi:GNAT superfamily N-acetyltransferase
MNIRSVTDEDADRLAALLGELGYPATPADVRERLARMGDPATDAVLVWEQGGAVMGCASLHVVPLFHLTRPMGRITALVVDERQRSRGIGKHLLEAAHAWFDARDCVYVEVTSGDRRIRAHRFYRAHGYVKKSLRFLRNADNFPSAPSDISTT